MTEFFIIQKYGWRFPVPLNARNESNAKFFIGDTNYTKKYAPFFATAFELYYSEGKAIFVSARVIDST